MTLLFSISCSNEGTTGGGNPVNVANAEFSGALTNISLTGEGWTQEQVDAMVNPNPFQLEIQDNKVVCSYIMQKQLRYPSSSNPNVVEANEETVLEDEDSGKTIYTAYIKITLDDANNPTTAEVEYRLKLYASAYAANPGYSDTFTAIYAGTLNKVTSSGS